MAAVHPLPATPSTPQPAQRMQGLQSSAIRDLLRDAQLPGMLSMAGGLPSPDSFDLDGLRDAMSGVMADKPYEALQYGVTDGQPSLRNALVPLLSRRGLQIDASMPLITTGSQQALDLVTRVMVDPGDTVALERPSYLAALQVFALSDARVTTIDVDHDGAQVEQLEAMSGPAPKLVYLVTNFANPSGATLSLERRLRLLRWAVRRNVLLVEDDPYGELRIRGEAIAPLLALARDIPGAAEHCIYISSLSKILSPGMRLGFILAPPAIREALIRAKQAMDLHTSSFAQEIVARYLQTDRLSQRMPMLRAIYRERNDALAQALTRTFGDHLQFNRPDGGMFLWARFTDGTDTMRLLAAARQQGVIFVPGSAFFPALDAGRPGAEKPDVDPNAATLRLSFATLTPSQLQQAVQRLATAHTSLR